MNLSTKCGLCDKIRPQHYEPAAVSIDMPNMESRSKFIYIYISKMAKKTVNPGRRKLVNCFGGTMHFCIINHLINSAAMKIKVKNSLINTAVRCVCFLYKN